MNWQYTIAQLVIGNIAIRDFKRFMLMSPSEYARLPHPILAAAAHARMAVAGEAMQVLHSPAGQVKANGPKA